MLQFLQDLFGPKKVVVKKEDKIEYLGRLAQNLEKIKKNNKKIPARIIEMRSKGFIIKAGGLFGFMSFEHMPWSYNNQEHWKSVGPHMTGKRFYCLVYNIENKETEGVKLIVDGKSHKFYPMELEEGAAYSSVVLQKTSYGLFLDVGYHFNWKFGSLVGLAHISTFPDIETFNNANNGHILTTYFQGFSKDNKPILGDYVEGLDFLTQFN